MKIIGVEIRLGLDGVGLRNRLVEVKLVPLEAVLPKAFSHPHIRPVANFTVHTSLGDVGSGSVLLPKDNIEDSYRMPGPSEEQLDQALRELAAQFERVAS